VLLYLGCFAGIDFILYSFIILVSLFFYLLTGNLIDAEKILTTVSLLNNIIHPLNVFPWLYDNIMKSERSFNKFIDFMQKKDITLINYCNEDDITLTNVTLGYTEKSEFRLHKVTFNAKFGEITMLYGNNATGKSLLLKSLVNEALVAKNMDSIFNIPNKKISYISQDLWTFCDTIKENICMGVSKEGYNDLIENCCLKQDFNIISDQTGN
jgi:ATP-binding cassette subfamily C (CFTR/MRP) protein 10